MSTDLDTITGRYESSIDVKATYRKADLTLTRFWGGTEGKMLQLTIVADQVSYIQLTSTQVNELRAVLANWDNYDIYPSE